MDKRRLSPDASRALLWVARAGIDDLYSSNALSELAKRRDTAPSRVGKITTERHTKLIEQLPEGIYTKTTEIIALVKGAMKRIGDDSLSFSPLVLSFKEFNCCKLMKYNRGNIITGRDREIEDILLTLCKRSKRGTILVGEPGVGKTAIVNAINARLIQRTVPRQLIGCQVFNLDVPYVFSKYKEDPIGTIIKVLERASEYDKAILFIDEVHQLLGAKMNDIMKPYLTEKIRFIGSTTINEFHSIVTDDSALERRFTVIHVAEPTIEQTVGMVTNTKSVFEEHHKCTIPDDICRYAVENGSRFLGHRRNPDKSLDVVDIACSIMYEKEIELRRRDYPETGDPVLDLERNSLQIKTARTVAKNRTLNEYYVNQAISQVTGIPYDDIKNSLNYDEVRRKINEVVVNQDDAVSSVSNVVNIFKNVKSDRTRPISVILMAGPPGVGKKTVAELLARNLFGHEKCFIDYDMSAFKDGFAITELKGSPPGYVGYGKSGGLIKKVRNMPQSVVFFRGINKAHESIQQYLIDACRTGKMVDSAEREAKLNNAIIVFSITLSEDQLDSIHKQNRGMGFSKREESDDIHVKSLEKIVGHQLLNSVDEIIQFNELNEDDLEQIYERNRQEFLDMYHVSIDLDELGKAVLEGAKNGHDVMSRLSAEVPKLVFQTLSKKKEKKHGKKQQVSKKD